jgi:hypothetical protein
LARPPGVVKIFATGSKDVRRPRDSQVQAIPRNPSRALYLFYSEGQVWSALQCQDMLKTFSWIGGVLLATWGFVRGIVDLLESIRATRCYAEFLYAHRYAAGALLSGSGLLTVVLLIVGAGLIFSESLTGVANRWWPHAPNIKLQRVMNAGVSWDAKNGCYVRQPNLEHPTIAIILEIANEVEHGKASPTAGRIKAQITYHFQQPSRPDLRVVPCAWVDEPLSSVELDCGDTRWLIAALSFHFTQDWRVPVNRPSNIGSPQSFDHHEFYGWSDTQGTMDVELLSMHSNTVLKRFTFDWEWKTGYPLALTGYKGAKGV